MQKRGIGGRAGDFEQCIGLFTPAFALSIEDFDRLRLGGKIRADYIAPMVYNPPDRYKLAGKALAGDTGSGFRQRAHVFPLMKIKTMTIANAENKISDKKIREFRGQILDWYDRFGRSLPWRMKAGKRADAYRVWLSEVMLQQTTVGAVMNYYTKFIQKWPEIGDLAAANQDDVMREWAGLGYYARARNLHACAKAVVERHGGVFPKDRDTLLALPGIGDYTSAAIMAIAYNKPATVMDGNIERVMARYFAIEQPLPKSKPILKSLASAFFEELNDRPGDFAQGLMDLGATICIGGGAPRCHDCPVAEGCKGRARGIARDLPRKLPKAVRPKKYGRVYWVLDRKGRILLHRRPERGLLGGMAGLPTSPWLAKKESAAAPLPENLPLVGIVASKPAVKHVFTHFDLTLDLFTAQLKGQNLPDGYYWAGSQTLDNEGLPSVFQKAVKVFTGGAP